MTTIHTFHIPVMGTGFSIDTPVKVARYGISSVISLVDDTLIEEMRRFYCEQYGEPYEAIDKYDDDHRAKRITAYLNLVDIIVQRQFTELKASLFEAGTEITKYFELLPSESPLKALYNRMLATSDKSQKIEIQSQLREMIRPGDINVNIMTKVDRLNFSAKDSKTLLPPEFSDALSALRGYAQSTLHSAIVFSAGINQRLYTYTEQFKDFYADASGYIKKRIILKVSDFRSSIIQGKFFAKKGLWISEYRIESGLNCGGHVFPTEGFLMGPILEEFKTKKQELVNSLHEIYNNALKSKNKQTFEAPHNVRITAQGGIGTAKEDKFLRSYYGIESTGWGTPFLLCPEATNVEDITLQKLANATEQDLYVSDVSPLGVPFNNLRESESEIEKMRKVEAGRPGSPCPKGHLVSNTEFTLEPICTASRLYQKLKIEDIAKKNLPVEEYKFQQNKVIQKACICNDLAEGALLKYNIGKNVKKFTAVCPGPNLAYFSKIVTLREIVDHIYGRLSILNATYRPNMFIKELQLYIEFLVKDVTRSLPQPTPKQIHYFTEYKDNVIHGIEYYRELFPKMLEETKQYRNKTLDELEALRKELEAFVDSNPWAFKITAHSATA